MTVSIPRSESCHLGTFKQPPWRSRTVRGRTCLCPERVFLVCLWVGQVEDASIHSLWGSLLQAARFYSECLSGVWLTTQELQRPMMVTQAFAYRQKETRLEELSETWLSVCPSPNSRECSPQGMQIVWFWCTTWLYTIQNKPVLLIAK